MHKQDHTRGICREIGGKYSPLLSLKATLYAACSSMATWTFNPLVGGSSPPRPTKNYLNKNNTLESLVEKSARLFYCDFFPRCQFVARNSANDRER